MLKIILLFMNSKTFGEYTWVERYFCFYGVGNVVILPIFSMRVVACVQLGRSIV